MIRIGARSSALARAQADQVADALRSHGVQTEYVPIRTQGDVDRRELTQIGGTGVFAAAVREQLLDGSIDVAVHSCKDLPTTPVDGLEVIAHPAREDTRDVLVGLRMDELVDRGRAGSLTIGTGAPRRTVQLQQLAAERGLDLGCRPIRGNVETRISLVRDGVVDAVVLAAAGLRRLGLLAAGEESGKTGRQVQIAGLPAELLTDDQVLSAPGQAALAIEIRSSLDSENRRVLTRLDDAVTRAEVLAERRFLAVLEAGCTAPVGARAKVGARDPGTDLTLAAVLGTTGKVRGQVQLTSALSEGSPAPGVEGEVSRRGDLIQVRGQGSAADPVELGSRLAELVLSTVDLAEIPR